MVQRSTGLAGLILFLDLCDLLDLWWETLHPGKLIAYTEFSLIWSKRSNWSKRSPLGKEESTSRIEGDQGRSRQFPAMGSRANGEDIAKTSGIARDYLGKYQDGAGHSGKRRNRVRLSWRGLRADCLSGGGVTTEIYLRKSEDKGRRGSGQLCGENQKEN